MLKTKEKTANTNIESRLSKARNSSKVSNSNRARGNRKRKACHQGCRKHEFQFKPLGFSSFLSKGITQPIIINFCTKGNSTTLPIIPQQLMQEPQVPLFILEDDIHRYQHHIESHRNQLKDAIEKAEKMAMSDEEQQIIFAIPKNKNCQICRIKIDSQEQYNRHISCKDHELMLRRSVGQRLIEQQTNRILSEKVVDERRGRIKRVCELFVDAKRILKGLLVKRKEMRQ